MADTLSRQLATIATGSGRRQHVAVVVFGTWMITGLFLDGWSHNHHRPETFFTPWHAVLYSGFAVAVAWFLWDGRRSTANRGVAAIATDRLTAVGLGLFAVAAVGDFGWHAAFGIERSIAALLSPTHLLLMTGGLLMVTEPIRGAAAGTTGARDGDGGAAGWRTIAPSHLSLLLSTALVSFFFMYLSPFRGELVGALLVRGPAWSPFVERAETIGIASVLVANVVLVGGLLLTVRRWRTPPGAFTLLFAVVALAMSGLDSFNRPGVALSVIAGGVVADWLIAHGAGSGSIRSLRILAGTVPAATWLPYFAVLKLAYGLPWTVHLWLGTVFLTVLTGLGLSLLVAGPLESRPSVSDAEVHA